MDKPLKQRLIGAAVLTALAVVFLPMLLGEDKQAGEATDVPLDVPPAPAQEQTMREVPLTGPMGEVPANGVTGMGQVLPPSQSAAQVEDPSPAAEGPGRAAGEYAVSFGSYASNSDAERIVGALSGLGLAAFIEPVTLSGRAAFAVRIGPFANQAEAEAARVKALTLGNNAPARVIALNAAEPATAAQPANAGSSVPAQAPKPTPVSAPPLPAPAKRETVRAADERTPAPAPVAAKAEAPMAPRPAEPAPGKSPAASNARETAATRPAAAAPARARGAGYAVQLGAFSNSAEATALRDRARAAGLSAFTETVNTANGPLTRVRIGPVADRAAAEELKAQAAARLGTPGMVRQHP